MSDAYKRCEECDGCGVIEFCRVCKNIVDNCTCESSCAADNIQEDCDECNGTGEIENVDNDCEEEE